MIFLTRAALVDPPFFRLALFYSTPWPPFCLLPPLSSSSWRCIDFQRNGVFPFIIGCLSGSTDSQILPSPSPFAYKAFPTGPYPPHHIALIVFPFSLPFAFSHRKDILFRPNEFPSLFLKSRLTSYENFSPHFYCPNTDQEIAGPPGPSTPKVFLSGRFPSVPGASDLLVPFTAATHVGPRPRFFL